MNTITITTHTFHNSKKGIDHILLAPIQWAGHQWTRVMHINEGSIFYKVGQIFLKILPFIFLSIFTLFAYPLGFIGSVIRSRRGVDQEYSIKITPEIQKELKEIHDLSNFSLSKKLMSELSPQAPLRNCKVERNNNESFFNTRSISVHLREPSISQIFKSNFDSVPTLKNRGELLLHFILGLSITSKERTALLYELSHCKDIRVSIPDNEPEYFTSQNEKVEGMLPIVKNPTEVISSLFNLQQKEVLIQAAKTIEDTYQVFNQSEDKELGEDLLNQVTVSLQKLKKVAAGIWKEENVATAFAYQQVVDFYNKKVQEMNFESSTLTNQDMKNLGTFYTSPTDKVYQDEKSRVFYWTPDHSKIFQFVSSVSVFDEVYSASGLMRGISVEYPRTEEKQNCDLFYMKKTDEQIAYENPDKRGWFSFLHAPRAREIIKIQNEGVQKLEEIFRENYKKWGYESFVFLGTNEAMQLIGTSYKAASENHAIAFFHRKYSPQEE